jgi:hypothetical protein
MRREAGPHRQGLTETMLMIRALLMVVIALVPVSAAAQARESIDARHRADCRFAGQILTTGHPATHRAWAFEMIDQCQDTGPAVLTTLWWNAPAAKATLDSLTVPSVRLWDQRLFDALVGVAKSRSGADFKRVAALIVLSTYAEPHSGMSFQELTDPRPDSSRALRLTSVDHRPKTVGAQPLADTARADVRRLLQELVASEPKSVVGIAANRLLRFVIGQN